MIVGRRHGTALYVGEKPTDELSRHLNFADCLVGFAHLCQGLWHLVHPKRRYPADNSTF